MNYKLSYWKPLKVWERHPTYNEAGVACYKGLDCDTNTQKFYKVKYYKNKKSAINAFNKLKALGKDALWLYGDGLEMWGD
jgi:hypothetical protein